MMSIIGNRRVAFVVVLLVMFTLSGCVFGETSAPRPPQQMIACDEETFGEFYEQMGGLYALGPCISPLFEKNGLTYQYTLNALMIYDHDALVVQQYRLGEIGYNINLDLTSLPEHGYRVWEEVEPLYTKTGGVFGLALTEVLRDEANQRYVQYFEGAAFYRYYTDEPGTIYWLPYGLWFCGAQCQQYVIGVTPESFHHRGPMQTPTPPVTPSVDEFTQIMVATSVERWDGRFTGPIISSKATRAADGWYELAYENIVLAVDPENRANVTLRPIPEMVGIKREMPTACWAEENFTCYLVTPELGFMVPNDFQDIIAQYGGWEVSGQPITALRPGTDGTSYQCFENLCLEYRVDAPESQRVSVMPLGSAYFRRDATPLATPDVPDSKLTIQTWPAYGLMPNGQAQEIYVYAFQGSLPVKEVLFSLSLTYPDGRVYEEKFPLTDANGQAILTLEPITAPEGTLVPYEVCYLGLQDRSICITGSFTIWSSPP